MKDSSDDDDDDDAHIRDPGISDDAQNAITRSFARTHPRLHLPHSDPPRPSAMATIVFDIRVATHDSDSTPLYPDSSNSSDSDTPHYWPEVTNPSPPTPNSPPPATITERQLMEWTESQLPWNIFRQQIFTYRDTPDELSGPPRLHRDLPNRTYMYDHAAPYANTLNSYGRISAFLRSDLPWSTYHTTLPPFVRRFYLNMPPTHSDHLDHNNSPPATTSRLGGYPTQHTHTDPDSKPLKRDRTLAYSDSDIEGHRPKQQSRSHSVSPSHHPLTHNSAPK